MAESRGAKAKPTVFEAWADVMRDMGAVGKDGWNDQQRFKFRGIDQLYGALAGPMRKHGVFLVPEILDKQHEQLPTGREGRPTLHVTLTIKFTIYGPDGDQFSGTMAGEAFDSYDKATSKAESMALKYFLFATAMIPLDESSVDDGDRHSGEVAFEKAAPKEPARGRDSKTQRAAPAPTDTPASPQESGQDAQSSGLTVRPSSVSDCARVLLGIKTLDELTGYMGGYVTASMRSTIVPPAMFRAPDGSPVTIGQLATLIKRDIEEAEANGGERL